MASLLLNQGKNKLTNVPFSEDVRHMIQLLSSLGAKIEADEKNNSLEIDTSHVSSYKVGPEIMKKMRASILVMGPLLARFHAIQAALPGGCIIGTRPIDFHLQAFAKMGVSFSTQGEYLSGQADRLTPIDCILEYPSVGATENIMMAAVLTKGRSRILNAALEPEVIDLIDVLRKMGAQITITPPATIEIEGVENLKPVTHEIMFDRLEAGSLLLAAAITGGEISLPQAPADTMDVFLEKLAQMGHAITRGPGGKGVALKATEYPTAVSFKTMPYPGFPTDLQAPMMTALCLASGSSIICETVFENRMVHVRELQKMGAQISLDGQTATVTGVDELYGTSLIAPDIRGGYGLLMAGLVAQGHTTLSGVHHLRRGYHGMVEKLQKLGALIQLIQE